MGAAIVRIWAATWAGWRRRRDGANVAGLFLAVVAVYLAICVVEIVALRL